MKSFLAALAIGVTTGAVAQDPSAPIIRHSYKDDVQGWTSMGAAAKVSVTHDSSIKTEGALQFDYKVEKGEMDALILPIPVGSLAKAKSIKFRVKTDTDTPLGVFLQEKEGGRYVAFCLAPKGAWQACELSTADFHLAQEANDPKDPDGKLDMDQVEGIGIVDLAEVFAGLDNAELNKLIHVQKGAHALFLDSFSVGGETVPSSSSRIGGATVLDTFTHPQLGWWGLGQVDLALSKGAPLEGTALKWTYKQEPNKIAAAIVSIEPGLLKDAKTLSFDLASVRGGTLRVQIEEAGGLKYSMSVDLPPGSKAKHMELDFSNFRNTEDSSDPKAPLDLGKVKSLLLMDQSGMLAQADPDHPDNTLWINHIQAK